MRTVQVELPDKLAEEIASLVEAGWFRTTDEVVRMAVSEFVLRNRLALAERFQRDDIAWALSQRGHSG